MCVCVCVCVCVHGVCVCVCFCVHGVCVCVCVCVLARARDVLCVWVGVEVIRRTSRSYMSRSVKALLALCRQESLQSVALFAVEDGLPGPRLPLRLQQQHRKS